MNKYTSKQLAECFEIKLDTWKRWSREFLAADPRAGRQGGVARTFDTKDAFRVFLGGHLVNQARFSVPAAKDILSSLIKWMEEKEYFPLHDYKNRVYIAFEEGGLSSWQMTIIQREKGCEFYAKGLIGMSKTLHEYDENQKMITETFISQVIRGEDVRDDPSHINSAILSIDAIINEFLSGLMNIVAQKES